MPFIRAKTRKNAKKLSRPERQQTSRTYYYLVESYRENGRVRQRTIAYLGRYSSVEDALARIPRDIARLKDQDLPWRCQQRDKAKAAYEEKLARFSKPFVFNERWWGSRHQQEREYREERQPQGRLWKRLRVATNKYREQEQSINGALSYVAELEARLAKLQALSNPDGSAHESGPGATFVGTTTV
jgi:hypothetical protein